MLPLIIDNFAGGGGASTGIRMALNREVDIAINHDADALVMHAANHPRTLHMCEDVWDVDPIVATQGRPVGLCWFSPSCTHFSRAKGAAPVEAKIRGLANVALRWAISVRPKIMMLENVEEFKTWGPLRKDGRPDKRYIGRDFRSYISSFEAIGYTVEWRMIRASKHNAATIRNRLFMIMRCDNQPIVWPEPTNGPGLSPELITADCIDWSVPCTSIFGRKRDLVPATMNRIAKGLGKFVINNPDPYIVPGGHVIPFITEQANGSSPRSMPIDEPLRTICANVKGGHFALCSAFIAKHFGGPNGYQPNGSSLRDPLGTVTSVDHNSIVSATMVRHFSSSGGADIMSPIPTIMPQGSGKTSLLQAFMIQYYGQSHASSINSPCPTVTTRDRLGLVTVYGQDYIIIDIGMRMLLPRELFLAQGFPPEYILDPMMPTGRRMSKGAQVKMVGNSVCPPVACALVKANCPELIIN